MWELRYLNSCLGQLVSCKSLESPEIQQGYWFLWNLRYSSWKQLCLGVQQPEPNLPFEKEFCGYFAKEIPNWRDFGGIFFHSSLHFWVCVVGKIMSFNSKYTVKLFKKTFSAASLENLLNTIPEKNQIINQWEKKCNMVIVKKYSFNFLFAIWISAFLNLSKTMSSSLKVRIYTCLLSQDSHVFTFQELRYGICCHVLWQCLMSWQQIPAVFIREPLNKSW